jgi:hypothetical protein
MGTRLLTETEHFDGMREVSEWEYSTRYATFSGALPV